MDPEIRQYNFRTHRWLVPLCQGCPQFHEKQLEDKLRSCEDRIDNLEAISAEPGRIPRQYQDKLQQLQLGMARLRNKVNEFTAKKPQVKKSKYQGLRVES